MTKWQQKPWASTCPDTSMMSFVVSSFFAGIGGGLLAMYQCMAQANNFKTNMTYEILLIVVIGGIGSISGSVIASFLFTACNEWWLRFLDDDLPGHLPLPSAASGRWSLP